MDASTSGSTATESRPIPSHLGGRASPPIDVHKSAAAMLVREYLGDHVVDASPKFNTSTFRRKASRKPPSTEDLAQILVEDDAALKIQRQFRRFRHQQVFKKRSFGKFGTEAVELIRRYQQAAGQLQEETFASKARLVLHFDVNKTIIMSDKAQDSDIDFIVNSLLADCAWGRLEPGPVWIAVGRLATDRPANDLQLMSYRSYLDSFLLPFEEGKSAEVQRRNTRIKAQRQSLKKSFTEPGQPGEMFRGIFEKLRAALVLPEGHSNRGALFQNGDIHILPSFFNLLIHLQNQQRQFTIVFRTFGKDIPAVVEEMNLFCTGQHPQYPGIRMDGSDGRTDLRLSHPDSLAFYHRYTTKADGTTLFIGATEDMNSERLSRSEVEALAEQGKGMLLTRFKDIHSHFNTVAKRENRAFAIRDFYPFWKSRNERSHAGKLLFLDPEDRDCLKIFFDDNIGHTAAHIIDARNLHTGEPLPFKAVVGKHMLKVEPLNAILDPHYFVRAVHECVMTWLKSHAETSEQNADRNAGHRPRRSYGRDTLDSHNSAPLVANTSRRARDLWSILQTRVTALIRIKNALQNDD